MIKLTKIFFNFLFALLVIIILLEVILKFYYKSKPFNNIRRNEKIYDLIEHELNGGIILHILAINTLEKTYPYHLSFARIFKFKPNNKIRWDNYYYNNDKFIKEWSYVFHTNNYGLVQKNDISNKKSILFLGDSFAQGVGAKPWIDKFQGRISDLQVVNGSIFGTGFQQFYMMEQHLSPNIDIQKVVVLYIGEDISRNLVEGQTANFGYEFPLSNKDPKNYLNKIQKNRSINYKKLKLADKFKYFIANQHLFHFVRYFVESMRLKNVSANLSYMINQETDKRSLKLKKNKYEIEKKNLFTIKELHRKYGGNIYFIKMKTPQEILYKKDSYKTKITFEFIKQLTGNAYQCNFEDNINFFHPVDGHPNKDGYENLFECVKRILLDK